MIADVCIDASRGLIVGFMGQLLFDGIARYPSSGAAQIMRVVVEAAVGTVAAGIVVGVYQKSLFGSDGQHLFPRTMQR